MYISCLPRNEPCQLIYNHCPCAEYLSLLYEKPNVHSKAHTLLHEALDRRPLSLTANNFSGILNTGFPITFVSDAHMNLEKGTLFADLVCLGLGSSTDHFSLGKMQATDAR